MRVQLGGHTYWWDGPERLSVGDWVIVPGTPWCGPTVKRVSAVGDDLGPEFDDDELTWITRALTLDMVNALALTSSDTHTGTVASTEEVAS